MVYENHICSIINRGFALSYNTHGICIYQTLNVQQMKVSGTQQVCQRCFEEQSVPKVF